MSFKVPLYKLDEKQAFRLDLRAGDSTPEYAEHSCQEMTKKFYWVPMNCRVKNQHGT